MRIMQFILAAGVIATAVTAASAQVARDVPGDHWAYEAVNNLASKGLIKGYPPSGDFLGKRTVTRYEMAVLVERVLAQVASLHESRQPEQGPAIDQAQLDAVRKLVEEYRVELTVTGNDLASERKRLDAVQADIGALKDRVTVLEQGFEGVRQDVTDVKQGLQSTIDAIAEQAGRVDKLNSSKVDAGFGKMKLSGLLQVWFQGEARAPNRGQIDGWRLRRTEIKLSGNTSPRFYWFTMFDPAKTLSINAPTSNGAVTSVSVSNSSLIMQDAVVGAVLTPNLALEIGQQKPPLSMDATRSSSQLPTVERALFNTLPTGSGRVGDARDLGGMLRYTSPNVDGQLAVMNDTGNRQNNTDDNNQKEIAWHLQYKGVPNLMVGAYQAISTGVAGKTRSQRRRFGMEGVLTLGPSRVEVEAATAHDGKPTVRGEGGYVLLGHRLSKSWEVVARGDYWNPDTSRHGAAHTREIDLTLGINHFILNHNAKIQLNWVRKNIQGPLNSAGTGPVALPALGLDRNLFLLNFQQAF